MMFKNNLEMTVTCQENWKKSTYFIIKVHLLRISIKAFNVSYRSLRKIQPHCQFYIVGVIRLDLEWIGAEYKVPGPDCFWALGFIFRWRLIQPSDMWWKLQVEFRREKYHVIFFYKSWLLSAIWTFILI